MRRCSTARRRRRCLRRRRVRAAEGCCRLEDCCEGWVLLGGRLGGRLLTALLLGGLLLNALLPERTAAAPNRAVWCPTCLVDLKRMCTGRQLRRRGLPPAADTAPLRFPMLSYYACPPSMCRLDSSPQATATGTTARRCLSWRCLTLQAWTRRWVLHSCTAVGAGLCAARLQSVGACLPSFWMCAHFTGCPW